MKTARDKIELVKKYTVNRGANFTRLKNTLDEIVLLMSGEDCRNVSDLEFDRFDTRVLLLASALTLADYEDDRRIRDENIRLHGADFVPPITKSKRKKRS